MCPQARQLAGKKLHLGLLDRLRCVSHGWPVRHFPTFAARYMNSQTAGQTGLMQMQLLLTQHSFAVVTISFWRRSKFHRSGRSKVHIGATLKLTFRCNTFQQSRCGTLLPFAASARAERDQVGIGTRAYSVEKLRYRQFRANLTE